MKKERKRTSQICKFIFVSFHSTNIKKNDHTYYGKQNHQCKCCGRQFVLNNKHTKSKRLKSTIKKALKERLSLRAICRTFEVSISWLQSFAHVLWKQTPKKLGLSPQLVKHRLLYILKNRE